MPKVLVVATSRKTKGGITSVVKAHETGEQWKKFHCKWIETHRDGNSVRKLWYLATALIEYICLLPFYDIVHIHVGLRTSVNRKLIFARIALLFRKKMFDVKLESSNCRKLLFTFIQQRKSIYSILCLVAI